MDASTKSNITLNTLEKGLRSRLLHEQIATIVNMTNFLRENPFPFFVNAAVLRLCEAFRDECNDLRISIVRVMGECSSELKLVFSIDEVARRVLKVSHSNDPLARSLTLHMLARLSPVVTENKQIHHLIVTSLDSSEPQESAAAIVAMKEYASLSRTFSQTIYDKLYGTLVSPLASPSFKVDLVGVFANMLADVEMIMKIFALGERILHEACNQQLMLALVTSLTTLAISRRFAVSELLTLLIDRLKESRRNRNICRAILQNIKRLSTAAHMLTSSQISDLCVFGDSVGDREVQIHWLATLVKLTSQNVHKINVAVCESSSNWSHLLSNSDSVIRLTSLQLHVNLFQFSLQESIAFKIQNAFLAFASVADSHDSERLYRLMTAFICHESCPKDAIDVLVGETLNLAIPEHSRAHLLQFLVAAAEFHSYLYRRLCAWAISNLHSAANFTSLSLFGCLVYAPLNELPPELPLNHTDCWGENAWFLYMIARCAMRNGHWTLVGIPVLERIGKNTQSFATKMWLSALRDICSAALTDFTISALEDSVNNYESAAISLSTLCATRETRRYFSFPLHFVKCLTATYSALRSVLASVNSNLISVTDPSPSIQNRLSMRFRDYACKMMNCRELWSNLYRCCFDADQNTLNTVELYGFVCSFYNATLMMFVEQRPLAPILVPASSRLSLSNKRLRLAIIWAKVQLEKLDLIPLQSRLTSENLSLLTEVFGRVCCIPVCVPRFFFQQLKCTEIKLNISPQPNANESSVLVSSTQKVPLSIEGAIESTKIASIAAVIVKASAKFTHCSKNDSQSQTVIPHDGKFFSAQFLLTFPQSCTMEFTVDFTDKEARRIWESGAVAELKITVNS